MKKVLFAAVTMFLMLVLSGCGGGGSDPPPPVTTQILSDPALNGEISISLDNDFTILQGTTQSLFAGISPVTGREFRAFLNFPLTGSVPLAARILSARLELFIDSYASVAGTIPIRIELVLFEPPFLERNDFDRVLLPPRESASIRVFPADVGNFLTVDVTDLMVEAQRLEVTDFQVRILRDDDFPGLIEINDSTNDLAPLLVVTYL